MKHTTKTALLAGLVSLIAAGIAGPVLASPRDVVVGHLEEFGVGEDRGYDVSGPVRLIRTEDSTEVKANVQGLAGNTTYMAHLHAQACGDGAGGGHYKHDPSGAGEPPNELWLMFSTNPSGSDHDTSSQDWRVRDGARSVVIHDTDGAKIACADLLVS